MAISVLVVEDQPDIRDAVTTLLEGAGYIVHAAEDPDEATRMLGVLPRLCIVLWDPMTPRQSLAMVDKATMEGVHVAILPVSIATFHLADAPPKVDKKLINEDAILSIVREYCPLSSTGT